MGQAAAGLGTPGARVALVNIIKTAVLGPDVTTDEAGENLHVARLVALHA